MNGSQERCLQHNGWHAVAEQRTHVVADGQTLGRIAKRYGLSIEYRRVRLIRQEVRAICKTCNQ